MYAPTIHIPKDASLTIAVCGIQLRPGTYISWPCESPPPNCTPCWNKAAATTAIHLPHCTHNALNQLNAPA